MPQNILDSLQTYNTLIRESSDKQTTLMKESTTLMKEIMWLYKSMMPSMPEGFDNKTYNINKEKLIELKKEMQELTRFYKDYVNITNHIHGEYSHIWGSYAEKTLFDVATVLLQKHHQCDTFYYKTKKNSTRTNTSKLIY